MNVQPPLAAVTDEGLTLQRKIWPSNRKLMRERYETNVLSQLIPKHKAHSHYESYRLSVHLCSIRC